MTVTKPFFCVRKRDQTKPGAYEWRMEESRIPKSYVGLYFRSQHACPCQRSMGSLLSMRDMQSPETLPPQLGVRADHGHTTTYPPDQGDYAPLSQPTGAGRRDGLG